MIILDGAMGTEIIRRQGEKPEISEQLNIENPEIIKEIHRDYIKVGVDIIEANTFGSFPINFEERGMMNIWEDAVRKGIRIARDVAGKDIKVGGSIGPIGKLLYPIGEFSLKEMEDNYRKVFEIYSQEGIDMLFIETQIDLLEAKSALRIAREFLDIPISISFSLEDSNLTLTGSNFRTIIETFNSLSNNYIGLNCGNSPELYVNAIKQAYMYSKKPLILYPNAGLPTSDGNYSISSKEFVKILKNAYKMNVEIIGGCCGTTPEHIKELSDNFKNKKTKHRYKKKNYFSFTSRTKSYFLGKGFEFGVIGEKINPSGRKKLNRAIKEENIDYINAVAINQALDNVHALDVHLREKGEDSPQFYAKVIEKISNSVDQGLFLDVQNRESLEKALKLYPGKAVINSIPYIKEDIEKGAELYNKYGCGIVLLLMDDDGVAETFSRKKEVFQKALKELKKKGVDESDILVDPVIFPASVSNKLVFETLKFIKWCKLPTTIGLSNVSFGLPERKGVNTAYLTGAILNGLDSAIIDPLDEILIHIKESAEFLVGRRKTGLIKRSFNKSAENLSPHKSLYNSIIEGNYEVGKKAMNILIKERKAQYILDNIIISALKKVGDMYETQEIYLPGLIQSAKTVEKLMLILEKYFEKGDANVKKQSVVLATVQGDLHDIGKNIVALILRNNGIDVYDIGKNTSIEKIINAIEQYNPDWLGLSALMVTTLIEMEKTVKKVKEKYPDLKYIVGGAAVSPAFAKRLGAKYSKDALFALKVIKGELE